MSSKKTSKSGHSKTGAAPAKKSKLSKWWTNKQPTHLTEESVFSSVGCALSESSALSDVFEIDNSETTFQNPANNDSKSKSQIVFCLPHELLNTDTNNDQTETRQMIGQRKTMISHQLSAYGRGGKNKSEMIVKENLVDFVKETLNDIIRMCAEKHQNDEDLVEVREIMEEILKKCQNSKEPDLLQLSKNTEELEENVEGEKETVEVSQENNPLEMSSDNLLLTFYKALTNAEEQSMESSNKLFENLETELSIEEGFCNGKSALWVSGVSEHIKACHLHGLFSLCGKVDDVKIVADTMPPRSQFYAYILMSRDEDAENCIKFLNGVVFGGRKLFIKKTTTHLIYKEKITIEKEGQIPGLPAGEFPILLQVETKV